MVNERGGEGGWWGCVRVSLTEKANKGKDSKPIKYPDELSRLLPQKHQTNMIINSRLRDHRVSVSGE